LSTSPMPPPATGAPLPSKGRRSSHPHVCDVLVVGGGINGAGIARDLAGRGLSVTLCEKDDLAEHTSSSSTKLIHGGLRYLEYYEFSLVRKALAEREVLLKSAPHIMWPLRFVMPHDPGMRPVWMIRLGLFLYDHLARREVLAGSRTVDLRQHPAGAPLKPVYTKGFVYSDGWVDDARLVVLNAVDAAARGATVLTRWRCTDARRGADGWNVRLQSSAGDERRLTARALVNAAGPWAAQFLGDQAHAPRQKSLRLVKGSHIVVPKMFEHDHAYIFQNTDKRIIFAIPYEGAFTLIGTTDVEHHGPVGTARIDAAETAYLCEQASRYFARPVTPADVVWSYSGVRPLLDDASGDPSAVTRDYLLELDTTSADAPAAGTPEGRSEPPQGAPATRPGAPLLTVWGGKITTFRKLAEEAADLLAAPLAAQLASASTGSAAPSGRAATRGAWTRDAALPGGDLERWMAGAGAAPAAGSSAAAATAPVAGRKPGADVAGLFERFVAAAGRRWPVLPASLCRRYCRAYGTRIEVLMAGAAGGLGAQVAAGLFEAELRYLHEHEWARNADDVLWRRSKLGLHLTPTERRAVANWCALHWAEGGTTIPALRRSESPWT
jgi:glycerol-3-phosphate dehydrogenase